jgi:hypothetical protein
VTCRRPEAIRLIEEELELRRALVARAFDLASSCDALTLRQAGVDLPQAHVKVVAAADQGS